ncbi:carbon-nitrogen hydrolase family protein [Salipiger marinus]|uniref:carbon-nitrogen hydrolase family protein n=1 Tax=Salipiger marinus TaxID=555512 RepID=UPI001E4C8E95|nr:carbon-nitrogen hydrolase family protein [Salipiger manganoxidans]MCD1618220.1 carbon-nitrogen hydrolase family protein [Salipiger manganoxidans]MEB3418183.1 carbon-nitrogen hydrolase family protein [Salipiger manganoxidans]
MKIATAAYPMDMLADWDAYVHKLGTWVAEAAGQGAQLLVFPEYGAMELATLAGAATAADLEASLHAVSDLVPAADALHADLAARHGVHILAASAPVFDATISARPVNRARLFTPGGAMGAQDKQIMTRFEREDWNVVGGGPLQVFDTALGRIGILICYDSEYPLLGHALREAELLLVPSCTEALAGYSRVRIGAMARALEQQCVSIMSSTVGLCDWSEAVDTNSGRGGVFGPPDRGFPATGVLAEGVLDQPGWTYATLDLDAIARVRDDGGVLNRSHWTDQSGRDGPAVLRALR